VMLAVLAPHVKWFTDPKPYPTDYSLLLTTPLFAAYAIAGAAVGVAWLIQHRLPEPRILRRLERFAGLAPLALRLHLGIALVIAAAAGMLFVPSLRPERDALGLSILAAEALCGAWLLIGRGARYAALALALLGVVAMEPFSFESILEQVHILGIAVFLFLVRRGDPETYAALTLLRVAMGFGIAYGALTEKLLDPALARAFIAEHPFVNVLASVGVGDGQFAYLAGLTEFVIGVVIVSGQLTRPVIAIGAVLFTITLPVFGWSELLGHLPYFGIMFALFLAPSPDPRRVRRQLREGRIAA